MDILERADVPLYSSDDEHADADGLPNLPVLAEALLPPASEANGPPASSTALEANTAGCEASPTWQRDSGMRTGLAGMAVPRRYLHASARQRLDVHA